MSNACAVTTGKVRLAYCNVWEPKPRVHGAGAPLYSCQIIIPKTSLVTVRKVQAAIAAAIREGYDEGKFAPGDNLARYPLKDGDVTERPYLWGCWYVNTNNSAKPHVIDINGEPVTDHSLMYSGVYARVRLVFYPSAAAGKGVSASLGNIQRLEDGEALGTTPHDHNPMEDFAEPMED